MSGTQTIRASDQDRQEVVDRLRGAVEDGRLTMDEYMERMGLAYQAVTYGDLTPLHADLPAARSAAEREASSVAGREAANPALGPTAPAPHQGVLAGLPCVLRVMWAVWLTAVSINVVVWALVSATTGHLSYPWPLWVAGPFGAALFAISACVSQVRRNRPGAVRRVTPSKG